MPSSSLLWSVGSLALSSMILPAAASSYGLVETWKGDDFLQLFDFYTGADPTNGFVTYANQSYAESSGLVKVNSNGSFYMGVDHTTKLSTTGPGRESVRIQSNKFYDEGLFIIDLQHMPGSICGTWPAFWSVGKNWPGDGEIDIIEGVNKNEANEIVLHTSGTCEVSSQTMTGSLSSTECGENAGTTGCVVKGTKGSSGTPFNDNGGGVYAMQWTDEYIKFWFFARGSVPTSITEGSPNVTAFGTPMAHMQGSCSIAEHFKAQQFIFDTTFCGDWAGGVYSTSGCPVSDSSSSFKSCVAYVAENPTAFEESYWEINYIKIYQTGAATASGVSSATGVSETVSAVAEATNSVVTTAVNTANTAVNTVATTVVSSAVDSETTTIVPETTAVAASTADASAATEDGSSVSQSTEYVTMTTTICPIAESSAAAALAGGSSASEVSSSENSSTPSVSGASAESNGGEGASAATPSATGASAEANGGEGSSSVEAKTAASATPSSVTGASAEANGSDSASASTPSATAEGNTAEGTAAATPSSVTRASAEANGSEGASAAATPSNVSGASAEANGSESTSASVAANVGSAATPSSVSGASAEANTGDSSAASSAASTPSNVSGVSAEANGEGNSSQSGSEYYAAPTSSSDVSVFSTVTTPSTTHATSTAAASTATQGVSSSSGSDSGSSGSSAGSATTPSTPVFTGGANKLSLGGSSVIGALVLAVLL